MSMNRNERANTIAYLRKHAKYSTETLEAMDSNQLYNVFKRVEECMYNYPREIIAHYNSHPGLPRTYSDEEIRHMNYQELKELRNSLGLNKRGKRVKSSTAAPTTAAQAREVLKGKTPAQVAAEAILSNMKSEEHVQESFITREELEEMYPGNEYSDRELAERGIHILPAFGEEGPKNSRRKQ